MASGGEESPGPTMGQSPSGAGPYPVEFNVTLQSIHERATVNSALTSDYATQWGPVEAFRELVQNWRDGIIQSFKLSEQDFHVTLKENDNEIIYTATASDSYQNTTQSQECLGYIRWARQDGEGVVDITNRQATLEPWHLGMGSTTKATDKSQIGIHGEGLKIALLVLMRGPHHHAVQCRSGGFEWTFNFTNQRRLVTSLVRMTPDVTGGAHGREVNRSNENRSLPIGTVPNEDVQFLIGAHPKGRDEHGYPTERVGVTREEFKNWTRCALFLQSIASDNIVKTRNGDLLLDARFGGKIYLKGFLLREAKKRRSASITKMELKFGYNFVTGTTNRERESMTDSDDERRAIMAIWGSALMARGDLVHCLHMLLMRKTERADAERAEPYIQQDTKDRLKSYIREHLEDCWVHTAEEKTLNPRFDHIVQALGRRPLEVDQSYWAILKDSGFRTAAEEATKQFNHAAIISSTDELFDIQLRRLIRGGLEVCPETTDTNVMFVEVGLMELDSVYSHESRTLKIHEKWSTVRGATEELGQSQQTGIHSILLGAAQWLLRDALSQIPTHLFKPDLSNPFIVNDQRTSSQRQKQAVSGSAQRVNEVVQILRATRFEVYDGKTFDKWIVKWNKGAAWSAKHLVAIQLHRKSTCWHTRESLNDNEVIFSDMGCLSRIKEDTGKILSATTCFWAIVLFEEESFEVQVEKGQDYFLMMTSPQDLKTLVAFFDKATPSVMEADSANDEDRSYRRGTKNRFVGSKLKPVVRLPPPAAAPAKVPSKRPYEA